MFDRLYFAFGPGAYGQGASRTEAINNLKKKWRGLIPANGGFEVWSCPPGSVVVGDRIESPADARHGPSRVSSGSVNTWRT